MTRAEEQEFFQIEHQQADVLVFGGVLDGSGQVFEQHLPDLRAGAEQGVQRIGERELLHDDARRIDHQCGIRADGGPLATADENHRDDCQDDDEQDIGEPMSGLGQEAVDASKHRAPGCAFGHRASVCALERESMPQTSMRGA